MGCCLPPLRWQCCIIWRASGADFERAKRFAVAGVTLAFLIWFLGFMVVGGEWFAMWQSTTWNGQQSAFRFYMTALAGAAVRQSGGRGIVAVINQDQICGARRRIAPAACTTPIRSARPSRSPCPGFSFRSRWHRAVPPTAPTARPAGGSPYAHASPPAVNGSGRSSG